MSATKIELTEGESRAPRSWVSAGKTERRLSFRARIMLAPDSGASNEAAAAACGIRAATVSKWRTRFSRDRLAGLGDAPRSGNPVHYGESVERRILSALDEAPPSGFERWNGRLLAAYLGDVSKHQIWRVLARHGISLQRRRSRCTTAPSPSC